jgi:citrate lyase subunit beta/citryl-CoA lyase
MPRSGRADAPIESGRSFLFVPADDPRKLASAVRSGADVVVADLEDAVAPGGKAAARRTLEEFVAGRTGGPTLLVRVNAPRSEAIEADLACIRGLSIDGIVVPKAHPGELAEVEVGGLPVVAMVEDAVGVRAAFELAQVAHVVRLALGGVDLAAELGLTPRADGLQLLHVRSRLVIDSAAAGVAPPIDTPYLRYRDDDGLRAECELARSLGFGAKACIHPAQVEAVARAFAPSGDDLDWARAIVAAYEQQGRGVTAHDGEMIDAPVVARARALLGETTDTQS